MSAEIINFAAARAARTDDPSVRVRELSQITIETVFSGLDRWDRPYLRRLKQAGIATLADLARMTSEEILSIPGMGQGTAGVARRLRRLYGIPEPVGQTDKERVEVMR